MLQIDERSYLQPRIGGSRKFVQGGLGATSTLSLDPPLRTMYTDWKVHAYK